jgi:putative OPT family oligopeptide transporter
LLYIIVAGAFIAAVCGYMAGLIGASNSPISGVGILAVIGAALLLALIVMPFMEPGATPQLIAYALFATAIVFGIATISNDNLQDLKTGQLVGAISSIRPMALPARPARGPMRCRRRKPR